MKKWKYLFSVLLGVVFLHSCVLEEAPIPSQKTLVVVGDFISKSDSLLVQQFGKKHHAKVQIIMLHPTVIKARIAASKFNTNFDVLLIADEELRNELRSKGFLKKIQNSTLFTVIDRQFYNRHQTWLPISFNPLVLLVEKDSLNECRPFYFKRWQSTCDSVIPQLRIDQFKSIYLKKMAMSNYFKWLTIPNNRISNGQLIQPLNQLVIPSVVKQDTLQKNKNYCRYYMIEKKRFIATENSICIYKFARNFSLAQTFITYYASRSGFAASGRNALPCDRSLPSARKINLLEIN